MKEASDGVASSTGCVLVRIPAMHSRPASSGVGIHSPLQLAGHHFLTVVEGNENLRPLGEMCLWEGTQDIVFDRA